jgi:hypothetical protein
MRAAQYDIIIEKGATYSQPFKWTNTAGAAQDMTDLDFAVKFKTRRDGVTFLEGFYEGSTNTPTGDIVISEGGVAGTFGIDIARGVTEGLDFTQGYWYVEIANVLNTFRVVEGTVTLSKR